MKPTTKQVKLIESITKEIGQWRETKDITSSNHFFNIKDLCQYDEKLSDYHKLELQKSLDIILTIIRLNP